MILAEEFFSTARERYRIKLRREAGEPRPWTADPVLRHWRFCNVHREDDRTTAWLRENIRKPLIEGGASFQKITASTIAFRWFNRIETAERILDLLVGEWDSVEAARRLQDVSPIVSGAYIILGRPGMSKLDGVLWCIDEAHKRLTPEVMAQFTSLESAWRQLIEFPFVGKFTGYEFITDLRWTPVLSDAPDINTWASAGPGCARGLGWVLSGDGAHPFHYGTTRDQASMLLVMRELLDMSRDSKYWPSEWRPWEMRETEHWSCEVDKIMRARRGDRMKRRFA